MKLVREKLKLINLIVIMHSTYDMVSKRYPRLLSLLVFACIA